MGLEDFGNNLEQYRKEEEGIRNLLIKLYERELLTLSEVAQIFVIPEKFAKVIASNLGLDDDQCAESENGIEMILNMVSINTIDTQLILTAQERFKEDDPDVFIQSVPGCKYSIWGLLYYIQDGTGTDDDPSIEFYIEIDPNHLIIKNNRINPVECYGIATIDDLFEFFADFKDLNRS